MPENNQHHINMETKALTIVGRGPSWKECPFSTTELWGNTTNLSIEGLRDKNYTKLFAFDQPDEFGTPLQREFYVELEMARQRGIPIVSNRSYATEPFPMVDIAREFTSSYWMPTLSYAIAYALYLGYNKLFIDGIDQGPRWIYQSGKHHMVFWLGVAIGRKVDLRMGRGSMRWAYRLGFDELPEIFFQDKGDSFASHIGLKIRADEIANK